MSESKQDREQEDRLITHGWWVTSRPYRVMAELLLLSVISLAFVTYLLSRVEDQENYRIMDINPVYLIGIFSGGLGGAARSLIQFWNRTTYNMGRSDYWKHATPFYLGLIFGFLSILIIQSGLKLLDVPSISNTPNSLSFIALLSALCGLFSDKAERRLLSAFDKAFSSGS